MWGFTWGYAKEETQENENPAGQQNAIRRGE